MTSYSIDNIGICVDKLQSITRVIELWVKTDIRHKYVVCVDGFSLGLQVLDREYRFALQKANIGLPGSSGSVLALRINGVNDVSRIAGRDIFCSLNETANEEEWRYYFLGSDEESLRRLEGRIKKDYPNIVIAGAYSPPFTETFDPFENKRIITDINNSRPNIVWVGLGAPKQEKWLSENAKYLDANVSIAIGAVFDYYSGKEKEVPPSIQRLGLEGIHRMLFQPSTKMLKRIFVYLPIMLVVSLINVFNSFSRRGSR